MTINSSQTICHFPSSELLHAYFSQHPDTETFVKGKYLKLKPMIDAIAERFAHLSMPGESIEMNEKLIIAQILATIDDSAERALWLEVVTKKIQGPVLKALKDYARYSHIYRQMIDYADNSLHNQYLQVSLYSWVAKISRED